VRTIVVSLALAACAPASRDREDPDQWFSPPTAYDVSEPVEFTDQNYDFTGPTAVADLPAPEAFQTMFAPDDLPAGTGCPDWVTSADLPAEIEGIVTLLPRYYIKIGGCTPTPDIDSDEKYYGSYFVQDRSGGFFVLGDSKVAHFDMGDRVRLKVRSIKESFGQLMIASHDVVELERGPEPVYYDAVDGPLGAEHVSRVVRVEGTVATAMSTFGEVYLDGDDGVRYKFSLDAELNRRGITAAIGDRIQVTGPVLFSFDEYTVVVMRVGQLEWLDEADAG
jgi:hypothetical protein